MGKNIMNTHSEAIDSSAVFRDEIAAFPAIDSQTSIIFPQHRVRAGHHGSRWMRELADRFEGVVSLNIGWDGYTAVPVSFATAQFAAQIIERLCVPHVPAPNIVPGSDGSLQIEWHVGGYDIELDVIEPLKVEAYRLNQQTSVEDEIEIESDLTEIATWISEVAVARAAMEQAAG